MFRGLGLLINRTPSGLLRVDGGLSRVSIDRRRFEQLSLGQRCEAVLYSTAFAIHDECAVDEVLGEADTLRTVAFKSVVRLPVFSVLAVDGNAVGLLRTVERAWALWLVD